LSNQQSIDVLFLAIGNIEEDDRREIPLGIAFLCGQLKRANYTYKVLDLYNLGIGQESNTRIEHTLHQYTPKIIAISSTSYYIEQVKSTISFLRSNFLSSSIHPIIIVGGYISIIPNVIQHIDADIVCKGEGELIFGELMTSIVGPNSNNLKIQDITGIDYKENETDGKFHSNPPHALIKDLDSIAFPEFDEFNFSEYNFKGSLPMYSQRGCYNHCEFCDIVQFYGDQNIRRMSPGRIIDWIQKSYIQFHISRVDFMDDNFLNSRIFVTDFFEKFAKLNEQLKAGDVVIRINFQARSNEILRFQSILAQYHQFINCIEIGTESFSQHQLDRWHKNLTVLDNINAVVMLSELKIPYMNFYLWLDEKTTSEEFDENVEKILELPSVPIATPLKEEPIVIPNYLANYEISAIYDRFGVSSVKNLIYLASCESFLNETNESAKKISSVYIGLKKLLHQRLLSNSNNVNSNTIQNLCNAFFPNAEKLLRERLYIARDIIDDMLKIKHNKKGQVEKILEEKITKFEFMIESLLQPLESELKLDINALIKF
jgi:radical SAM superfamily enzyme YgiQ (UPF0313 family)